MFQYIENYFMWVELILYFLNILPATDQSCVQYIKNSVANQLFSYIWARAKPKNIMHA